MPEINSPLGRRLAASSSPQVLTVPNEEAPQQTADARSEFERVQSIRREKAEQSKRITSSARQRLDFLLGLGRATDDVEIEGVVFTLQTLKTSEILNILKSGVLGTDVDSFLEGRCQTLAYAISAINNESVDLWLGTDSIKEKIDWLLEMDETIIAYLHDRYLELVKKHKSKFTIATEEEAKEVIEDLKK